MRIKWISEMGPGALVAAAFIGPGTVTVCTIAGAEFGLRLLWTLLLSMGLTLLLQEMAARLGLISQKGLAEVVKSRMKQPIVRWLVVGLMLSAIVIGNAAYEAGNISGGAMGLQILWGASPFLIGRFQLEIGPLIIGVISFALLYVGRYKVIERVLIGMVILMSVSFLIAAVITRPDILRLVKGLIVPDIPKGSLLTIVGLIGTTVVPYNLFLHAALVKMKWSGPEAIPLARRDAFFSILLGGIVSMGIVVAASSIMGENVHSAVDLARSLEPVYGHFARYLMAIGLFSAGVTSAITAPLAAAWVAKESLSWPGGMRSMRFRMVWIFILVSGVFFSTVGWKPIDIIRFAQFTNGILLPVIAAILLWVVNRPAIMGKYTNSRWQNAGGIVLLGVVILLGAKSVMSVLGWL